MQTFVEDDVTQLVYLVADFAERHPEEIDRYFPNTKAVIFKSMAAAPKTDGVSRDIKFVLSVSGGRR